MLSKSVHAHIQATHCIRTYEDSQDEATVRRYAERRAGAGQGRSTDWQLGICVLTDET